MTPDTLTEWGGAILRAGGVLIVVALLTIQGAFLAGIWIDFIRWLRKAPDASPWSGLIAFLGTLPYVGFLLWLIGTVWQGGGK